MRNISIVILVSSYFLLSATEVRAELSFEEQLVEAAIERTKVKVRYDGSYRKIGYPNGDVPQNIGVCTDVIVRSYRKLGIDLQRLLHEDIASNFEQYPSNRIWGLNQPDRNIDHRRVPNLQRFFRRHGEVLSSSSEVGDYLPGDIVTWMLPGNLPHIGLVSNRYDSTSKRPLIVHNIGSGPEISDVLFSYPITGHYRYKTKQ